MIKFFIFLFLSLFVILPAQADEATSTSSTPLEFSAGTIIDEVTATSTEITSTVIYEVKTDRAPIAQPIIRVGLLKTKLAVRFKSGQDYNIYSGDEMVEILPANEEAVLSYKNGKYFLNRIERT